MCVEVLALLCLRWFGFGCILFRMVVGLAFMVVWCLILNLVICCLVCCLVLFNCVVRVFWVLVCLLLFGVGYW